MKVIRYVALTAILTVALLGTAPLPSDASPIVIAPSTTVAIGDTFSIDISITDAVDLVSWQFDLAFDPGIVSANVVTEAAFMSGFGSTLSPPTLFSPGFLASGSIFGISNSFVDLPPNPSGDGVLATIEFTALAAGISPITLSNVFLNFLPDADTVNGQITVTDSSAPIPEPSTMALLASGAALLRLQPNRPRRREPKERVR